MQPKRLCIIVNPQGGGRRGSAILDQVAPVFSAAGVEFDTRWTERAGHASSIAKTLDLDRYDGLCLIGGDGTIHEVVNGLMQRNEPIATPLGWIPGGTGNTVHQHLGNHDPIQAAHSIVTGMTCPFDVVRAQIAEETRYCVNIIGWGAAVDINRLAERLRPFGPSRYSMAALFHILRAQRRRARVQLDNQVLDDLFLLVLACNTQYTGKGMHIAPRAEFGDGMIDVILVRKASRLQMLRMFRRVFDGSHLSLPFVEFHQVRSFGIESNRRDMLNLDGELHGTTPVNAQVLPGAIKVYAPVR